MKVDPDLIKLHAAYAQALGTTHATDAGLLTLCHILKENLIEVDQRLLELNDSWSGLPTSKEELT